jgi:hypothetical protein
MATGCRTRFGIVAVEGSDSPSPGVTTPTRRPQLASCVRPLATCCNELLNAAACECEGSLARSFAPGTLRVTVAVTRGLTSFPKPRLT